MAILAMTTFFSSSRREMSDNWLAGLLFVYRYLRSKFAGRFKHSGDRALDRRINHDHGYSL